MHLVLSHAMNNMIDYSCNIGSNLRGCYYSFIVKACSQIRCEKSFCQKKKYVETDQIKFYIMLVANYYGFYGICYLHERNARKNVRNGLKIHASSNKIFIF